MSERRIIINILPQSSAAWSGLSAIAFFIAAAMSIRGCADLMVRANEAKAEIARAAHAGKESKP